MSYTNFIPTVWAEGIERELEKKYVYVEDCLRRYEGNVKKLGESVSIIGAGKPTVHTIAKKDRYNLADAEYVEGTSVIMYINRMSYYRYLIDDIDHAQAIAGVDATLDKETSEMLAGEVDRYISSFAVDDNVERLHGAAPVKVVSDKNDATGTYVLEILDNAIQRLYENGVSTNTDIVVTVSPRFFMLFKRAYITRDTDNSAMMKNGKMSMYGGVTVKMSNEVYKTDDGATDNIMIRTKRAIAFAQPCTFSEAQRAQNTFADELRGYILYDAKVVRPKEIVNINVKYA